MGKLLEKVEVIEEAMCGMVETVMGAKVHEQRWQFDGGEADDVNEKLSEVTKMWGFLDECLCEGDMDE